MDQQQNEQQSKAQLLSQPKYEDQTKNTFQKKGTPDRDDPRSKKNNAGDSSSSKNLTNISRQKANEGEQNLKTVDNSFISSSALNVKSDSYRRLNAPLDLELRNRMNTNWKYITLIVVLTLLAIYVLYFFDILSIGKKENNEKQQENEVEKNANADDKNNDTDKPFNINNDTEEMTLIDPKNDTIINQENKADGEENPADDDPKKDSDVSGDNSTGTESEVVVDDPKYYLYNKDELKDAFKKHNNRNYQTQEDNKDGNNSTLQNIIILGLFSYGLYYYFNKTKKIKKVKSKKVKSKK